MNAPTPEEVRTLLAPFDTRQQKIVAGMLTVMMKNPQRVKEREWIAEQLTELTLLAGDFEVDSASEGVAAIHEYLRANTDRLLEAAFLLFQRVGLDLQARASSGFTFEEALQVGMSYFPATGTGDGT